MTLTVSDTISQERLRARGELMTSDVGMAMIDVVHLRSTPAIEDLWTSTFNLRWGQHLHDPAGFIERRSAAVASWPPLESGRRRRQHRPD